MAVPQPSHPRSRVEATQSNGTRQVQHSVSVNQQPSPGINNSTCLPLFQFPPAMQQLHKCHQLRAKKVITHQYLGECPFFAILALRLSSLWSASLHHVEGTVQTEADPNYIEHGRLKKSCAGRPCSPLPATDIPNHKRLF